MAFTNTTPTPLRKSMLYFWILAGMFITLPHVNGQDPLRFSKEINRFANIVPPYGSDVVVYTGSSSIRMWTSLKDDCQGHTAINTGFGGSQMSDLLFFLEQTIKRFNPSIVYIYEGDNDIAAGKSVSDIMTTTQVVVNELKAFDPNLKIFFIGAKPSPSRWSFKEQYVAFNQALKAYCSQDPHLEFIDVWTPMLNQEGRPIPQIFISDSLHMNRSGYQIWKEVICGND